MVMFQVAAAPAAPAAPMEADDPRHAWAAQNQVAIQQRAQAEASKKVEVLAKAKEHLEKVNKVCTGIYVAPLVYLMPKTDCWLVG